MNKVILIGNIGKDPEIKEYTDNGGENKKVVKFSLATSEYRKEGESLTEWHNVIAYGRLADTIANHIKKGSKLAIEGKIRKNQWQGKDGENKSATEIVAEKVEMLDKKQSMKEDHDSIPLY